MPVASTTQARDEINAKLKAALDAGTLSQDLAVLWDDVGQKPPRDDGTVTPPPASPVGKAWIAAGVIHVDGRQASLGSVNGRRRHEQRGVLWVRIYTPRGDGMRLSDAIKDEILTPFRTAGASTPGGVVFSHARGQELEADGAWQVVNCLVDFSYDLIV